MVGITRDWIIRQLSLGEFQSHRDIWRKSTLMAAKIAGFAYGIDVLSHILLSALGLLPYSLAYSLLIATVLTPPLAFFVALAAYSVMGFAIHDLGVSRNEHERLSRTDMLSGLANRRAFQQAFDQCRRDKVLVIFDIDRFKIINDSHGHAAGDTVIAAVANMLPTVFGEQCLCARIGGEEFAVFSGDMPFAEFAAQCEMARIKISRMRIDSENGKLGVSISGGIARAQPDQTFGMVFSHADKALYSAKSAGRDRIVFAFQADEPESDVDTASVSTGPAAA